MTRPVASYSPSRRYLVFAAVAVLGALISAWAGTVWGADGWRYVSFTAAAAFVLMAGLITAMVLRPVVEIFENHLVIGRREIPWKAIRTVDQTSWVSPLTLRLGLEGEESLLLMYFGDSGSSAGLLRHVRRYARQALLDGVPYRQFWGETTTPRREPVPARFRLVSPQDEREIEQMFQRLKSVGRIDKQASEESNGE